MVNRGSALGPFPLKYEAFFLWCFEHGTYWGDTSNERCPKCMSLFSVDAKDDPMAKPRVFDTGASRDAEGEKLDYEAFLSPIVLERYAVFMHENRKMADGSLRDGDNWQKGIPKDVYMKSAWRHFMSWWAQHRDVSAKEDIEDAICALLFNASGYLYEMLRPR